MKIRPHSSLTDRREVAHLLAVFRNCVGKMVELDGYAWKIESAYAITRETPNGRVSRAVPEWLHDLLENDRITFLEVKELMTACNKKPSEKRISLEEFAEKYSDSPSVLSWLKRKQKRDDIERAMKLAEETSEKESPPKENLSSPAKMPASMQPETTPSLSPPAKTSVGMWKSISDLLAKPTSNASLDERLPF